MAKPSDTAPDKPAKTVTTNAGQGETAPPAVPSSPSADTRGGAGTSTAEGPSRPKADVPQRVGAPHAKQATKSEAGVSPPGERVDDEEGDDKRMTRQE